jgi:hypothetical protein
MGHSFEIASFQITENTLQAPKPPATSRGANINFIPRCANPPWTIHSTFQFIFHRQPTENNLPRHFRCRKLTKGGRTMYP